MHPKLNLICRILDKPEISKLTNGEYRTNVNLNTNGGLHHLEIISGSSWAENIELKKIFQLELDVTMTNDHNCLLFSFYLIIVLVTSFGNEFVGFLCEKRGDKT